MQLSLVLSVCFVAGLVGLLTAQCDRNGVDGCTTLGIPTPYKQRFTPSCNKHDVCYFCGAARGIRQKVCDDKFHTDMENSCQEIGGRKERERCSKWARNYIVVVRKAGFLFYEETSPSWCSESWVSGCLP